MNPLMLRTSRARLPPAAKTSVRVMVDSSTTAYWDVRCACSVPMADTQMTAAAAIARVLTGIPHWMERRPAWLMFLEVLRTVSRHGPEMMFVAVDAGRSVLADS